MKIVKKSICIILALFSILALNACGVNGEKEPETSPPAKEMNFEQIRDDFLANEVSAEQKHIGQRYSFINVKVVSIQKEYITIYDGRLNTRLHYKGQTDFVMSLLAGDKITFEGTLTEVDISPSHYGGMKFEDVVFIGKVD